MWLKQISNLIINKLQFIQILAKYAMALNQMQHLFHVVIISLVFLVHKDVNAVLSVEFHLMILLNYINNELNVN